MPNAPHFRASVAAIILNSKGQVLAFERSAQEGAWQFPQGGLEEGEKLRKAVERELLEETGINAAEDLEYIGKYPEWLAYELPKQWRKPHLGRGQVQKWFCYQVKDDLLHIDLAKAEDDEFREYRWMEMKELTKIVANFRKPAYRRLRKWLKALD